MKKQLIFCAVILSLISIIGWGWQEWKTFSSVSGGFSILTPGTPIEKQLMQETPMGKIFVTTFRINSKSSSYFIGYNDYPDDFIRRSNINGLLDGARDGSIGNLNGRLLTQHNISVNGYPGREYVAEFMFKKPGDSTVKTRAYLVNNRLFQISVMSIKGEVSVAQQNKFLNSFTLLK